MSITAWLRAQLTDEGLEVVNEERVSHPDERIRERMLVLRVSHNGVARQKAAEIAGVGRATVRKPQHCPPSVSCFGVVRPR